MDRHRFVERLSQLLFIVSLLGSAVGAYLILSERVLVDLYLWCYLLLIPIVFGQSAWNGTRSRRATDPARRRELLLHSTVQVAIGLYFVGQLAYTLHQVPEMLLVQ